MTETAPKAPPADVTELWHVDFHLSYEPSSLTPYYINCDVSKRIPHRDKGEWQIEGIASFDAPALVVPRAGADLIPYLIYHLDEIKSWLVEEHVRRVFNGQEEKIGDKVGLPVQTTSPLDEPPA